MLPPDSSGDPGSDSAGGSLDTDDAPVSLSEASCFFRLLLNSALTIPFNVFSSSTGCHTKNQDKKSIFVVLFLLIIFGCQLKNGTCWLLNIYEISPCFQGIKTSVQVTMTLHMKFSCLGILGAFFT